MPQFATILVIPILILAGCCSETTPASEPKGGNEANDVAKTKKASSPTDTSVANKKEAAVDKAPENSAMTPLPWADNTAPPKRIEGCVKPDPNGKHLGQTTAELISCIESIFKKASFPEEIKLPFAKKNVNGMTVYESPKFMSIVIKKVADSGQLQEIEVFFFNDLREKYGIGPEYAAQYATLAATVPSAMGDVRRGMALYKSLDARRKDANSPMIDSAWDGLAINSSFMPMSVRYQFRPTK